MEYKTTLIADSGSTKCDWVLLDSAGKELLRCETPGLNPHFHTPESISRVIREQGELLSRAREVGKIHFYGAGCSAPAMQQIVKAGLKSVFEQAEIHVKHDLDAAAFALYNGEPEMVCILGTGSNCGYFDGRQTIQRTPNLGYVLGDEGSGSWIGKQLLTGYFYKRMPENMTRAFQEEYKIDVEAMLRQLFESRGKYLAGFAQFAVAHKEDSWIRDLVSKGFALFIETHIAAYPEAKKCPVQCVGSIAFIFAGLMRTELDKAGMKPGRIVARPIDGLAEYHSGRSLR